MRLFPDFSLVALLKATMRVVLWVYVLFGIFLYLRQDTYLFFPPETPMETCAGLPDAAIVEYGGTRAYHLSSGSSTKYAVLYHGNAERACDFDYLAHWIAHYGYQVLIVEYAGYAGDERAPSVALLKEDAAHMHAWLGEHGYSELLIVGRSLGTGFATHHAALAKPEKLLLISPFDTLSGLARVYYPVYPLRFMLTTDLDNASGAALAKRILLIHGVEDDIIPLSQANMLFGKLPQTEKSFVEVERLGHNDLLGRKESWQAMHEFLK